MTLTCSMTASDNPIYTHPKSTDMVSAPVQPVPTPVFTEFSNLATRSTSNLSNCSTLQDTHLKDSSASSSHNLVAIFDHLFTPRRSLHPDLQQEEHKKPSQNIADFFTPRQSLHPDLHDDQLVPSGTLRRLFTPRMSLHPDLHEDQLEPAARAVRWCLIRSVRHAAYPPAV